MPGSLPGPSRWRKRPGRIMVMVCTSHPHAHLHAQLGLISASAAPYGHQSCDGCGHTDQAAGCTALRNPTRCDDGPAGTVVRLLGRAWCAGGAAHRAYNGAGRLASVWSKSLRRGEKGTTELRSRGGPATLDKCMMGDIQGPRPHHGTGHGAHSSTGGCQRWSNLAA